MSEGADQQHDQRVPRGGPGEEPPDHMDRNPGEVREWPGTGIRGGLSGGVLEGLPTAMGRVQRYKGRKGVLI